MNKLIGLLLLGTFVMMCSCSVPDDGQVEDGLQTESLGGTFLKKLQAVMATDLYQLIDRLVQVKFFNKPEMDPTGYSNFWLVKQRKHLDFCPVAQREIPVIFVCRVLSNM